MVRVNPNPNPHPHPNPDPNPNPNQVEVEGEAPAIRKGALKPIKIEMKRAAGHNKTHVSGLEGLLISPDAVSQVLKIKVGCTTAVLKLPGNNVKVTLT